MLNSEVVVVVCLLEFVGQCWTECMRCVLYVGKRWSRLWITIAFHHLMQSSDRCSFHCHNSRRLAKLEMLKRRGKGPPKKGKGKRASKRKWVINCLWCHLGFLMLKISLFSLILQFSFSLNKFVFWICWVERKLYYTLICFVCDGNHVQCFAELETTYFDMFECTVSKSSGDCSN